MMCCKCYYFTVCRPTLNIRSILHPLRSAALSDLIVSHHPDLFCLTETWVKNSTNCNERTRCTPPKYTFLNTPRRAILLQSLVVVLVFLYVNPSLSCLLPCPSFPHLNTPQLLSSCLSIKSLSSISIIHPHHLPFLKVILFFDEFNSFLSVAATTPHKFVITGDFNIHLDCGQLI